MRRGLGHTSPRRSQNPRAGRASAELGGPPGGAKVAQAPASAWPCLSWCSNFRSIFPPLKKKNKERKKKKKKGEMTAPKEYLAGRKPGNLNSLLHQKENTTLYEPRLQRAKLSGQPPSHFRLGSVTIYHLPDAPLLHFCPHSLLKIRILMKLSTDGQKHSPRCFLIQIEDLCASCLHLQLRPTAE